MSKFIKLIGNMHLNGHSVAAYDLGYGVVVSATRRTARKPAWPAAAPASSSMTSWTVTPASRC